MTQHSDENNREERPAQNLQTQALIREMQKLLCDELEPIHE